MKNQESSPLSDVGSSPSPWDNSLMDKYLSNALRISYGFHLLPGLFDLKRVSGNQN